MRLSEEQFNARYEILERFVETPKLQIDSKKEQECKVAIIKNASKEYLQCHSCKTEIYPNCVLVAAWRTPDVKQTSRRKNPPGSFVNYERYCRDCVDDLSKNDFRGWMSYTDQLMRRQLRTAYPCGEGKTCYARHLTYSIRG
jgi:hypothetical protein